MGLCSWSCRVRAPAAPVPSSPSRTGYRTCSSSTSLRSKASNRWAGERSQRFSFQGKRSSLSLSCGNRLAVRENQGCIDAGFPSQKLYLGKDRELCKVLYQPVGWDCLAGEQPWVLWVPGWPEQQQWPWGRAGWRLWQREREVTPRWTPPRCVTPLLYWGARSWTHLFAVTFVLWWLDVRKSNELCPPKCRFFGFLMKYLISGAIVFVAFVVTWPAPIIKARFLLAFWIASFLYLPREPIVVQRCGITAVLLGPSRDLM